MQQSNNAKAWAFLSDFQLAREENSVHGVPHSKAETERRKEFIKLPPVTGINVNGEVVKEK